MTIALGTAGGFPGDFDRDRSSLIYKEPRIQLSVCIRSVGDTIVNLIVLSLFVEMRIPIAFVRAFGGNQPSKPECLKSCSSKTLLRHLYSLMSKIVFWVELVTSDGLFSLVFRETYRD
jgi:hypothetical protein